MGEGGSGGYFETDHIFVAGCGVLTTALPAWAFSSTNKARVLYVGDSIAANTVGMVTFWLNSTGKAEVVGHPGSIFPGTAICNFLTDGPSGSPITIKLKQAVEDFAGAPGARFPAYRHRPRRLNDIYALTAGLYEERTIDAGVTVSPTADRYRLEEFLPCTVWEFSSVGMCTQAPLTRIHLPNEIHFCQASNAFLHFCTVPSPGVDRYVVQDAMAWLGI